MTKQSNQSYGNYHSGNYKGNNFQQRDSNANVNAPPFNKTWINEKADIAMVSYAEDSGKYMAQNGLTNSKIRSIYGEIKRIQMMDFEHERSKFYLLKPKVAYALGRDPNNAGLKRFKSIFDEAYQCVHNQMTFNNFCNFIEAILAYHKAYGGKE